MNRDTPITRDFSGGCLIWMLLFAVGIIAGLVWRYQNDRKIHELPIENQPTAEAKP